jgi:hypothetical protein
VHHLTPPDAGKWYMGAIVSDRKWALPKWHTLRFLLALSREQRVGKI